MHVLQITSPLECRALLFDKLKLDAGIRSLSRTSTGAKSTDEPTLLRLIEKTGYVALPSLSANTP
jgi:DNA polymerase I-like protein with 3'-5' exonuclease and polymerase domains